MSHFPHPQMMQHPVPVQAAPQKHIKKRQPIDKQLPRKLETFIPETELYNQLVRHENKLDAIISRKKLDLQEVLTKPLKNKRTLRVFVSNFASDQYEQVNTLDNLLLSSEGVPSWTLKIEGRLLDLSHARKAANSNPKFTSFIKAMYVELQRDVNLYPEGNIIEWHKKLGSNDYDGFEIKRTGDVQIPVKIILHLEYTPEKFRLRDDLARLLDIHTDNKANILIALWQYIKNNRLQDQEDAKMINLDEHLERVFEFKKIELFQLPELVNLCVLPPEPVVIEYTICVDKDYNMGKYAFDIEVEVNDPIRFKMNNFMGGNSALNKEIHVLEEKISAVIQAIHHSKTKRDFMFAFAKDPVNFLNQFVASQSKDMELILGDVHVNKEECRKAEFWTGEWVNEAISHYLQNRG